MCFRPIRAERNETAEQPIKMEEVSFLPKQIKVIIKNKGTEVCSLRGRVMIQDRAIRNETEHPVTWSQEDIPQDGTSTGTIDFEWESGKTYDIATATLEGQVIYGNGKAP